MSKSVTRRSFLGASAVAVAGLGLAGCATTSSSSDSSSSSSDVEPQAGSPATTDLASLPLPEAGKTYDNPKDRDEVQDGGTLTLPAPEIGPDWNQLSVTGNTTYMLYLWNWYMPCNCFICDATGSTFTPNADFVSDYKEETIDGKEVCTITYADEAQFNDGTPIDYRAFKAVWTCMSGQNSDYTPSSTDGYQQIESVEAGSTDKECVVTFSTPYYPAQALFTYALHPDAADPDTFNSGWSNEPHNEWGAGPFAIDSSSDTQVTFKRNDAWWGDTAKLETVTYKQMESQAEYNAFRNGEIDSTTMGASGSNEMLSNFSESVSKYYLW